MTALVEIEPLERMLARRTTGRRVVAALRHRLGDAPMREGLGEPVAQHAADQAPGTRVKRRVLVADDDAEMRAVLEDMLETSGYDIVLAVDGADAVEKFKTREFDIVVTDLAMPRLNGLQVARVCKRLKPSVPVLVITGWGIMVSGDEMAENGVDALLSKPVRKVDVLGALGGLETN